MARKAVFLYACVMMVFMPVDCCRFGISRMTRATADAAVAVRQQTESLGESIRKSVETLRVDVGNALQNLDRQMGTVVSYVTTDLGPSVQHTLMRIQDNSQEMVNMVRTSLDKLNVTLDKASLLIDLLTVLVFLIIGVVCRITLNGVHLGLLKHFVRLIEMVSFVTAAALVTAILCRIFTGIEPSTHHMVNIVTALLVLLVVLYIWPAVLTVMYYVFFKIPVTVVDTLTLAPFRWFREATYKYSYARLFTVYIPLLLLFQTAVWLFGFVMLGKNVITASLLTFGAWWSLAFGVRRWGPRHPKYAVRGPRSNVPIIVPVTVDSSRSYWQSRCDQDRYVFNEELRQRCIRYYKGDS